MALIRTFVAIELSDTLKSELDAIEQRLKKELGQLKWVPKTNFHLTLKFLGDVDSGRIAGMADGLARAIQGTEAFPLNFAEVGGFPKIASPRVIWVGVDEGKESLIRLQKLVDAELQRQGFPAEKQPYSPHLTLARAREESDLRSIGERLRTIQVPSTGQDQIRSIRIMKSDLRPGGPVYTCLKEITF